MSSASRTVLIIAVKLDDCLAGSWGRLSRLLVGIPVVPDPRPTTGAAQPFPGVALRFEAPQGDCMAAWKACL